MRIAHWSGAAVAEIVRRLRRRAAFAVVIMACGLVVIIESLSAARLALEPVAGPVGSRLVLAGIFLFIAAGAAGLLVWSERRAERAAATAREARTERDPRGALIAEAVSLGYSLGRDFMKASANGHASPGHPAEDTDPSHPDGDKKHPGEVRAPGARAV
ncbi:MAG TPA: hypothetical protein VFQ27_14485 [Xanthobacteraceae bacterium]|nr:hypothetical protein [Xanthobacteraceae bacterium]